MEIAFLGWGSLIWDPRNLPIRGGWCRDGPLLPIEFARRSKDGRITLVIVPERTEVQTLWAMSSETELDSALEALKVREGTAKSKIGCWVLGGADLELHLNPIAKWARVKGIEAVIWTALNPGLTREDKDNKRCPTIEEVIEHLNGLPRGRFACAEHYVRSAPRQIDTEYRRALERHFGWFPNERADLGASRQ